VGLRATRRRDRCEDENVRAKKEKEAMTDETTESARAWTCRKEDGQRGNTITQGRERETWMHGCCAYKGGGGSAVGRLALPTKWEVPAQHWSVSTCVH
jgi:hypothetical protein